MSDGKHHQPRSSGYTGLLAKITGAERLIKLLVQKVEEMSGVVKERDDYIRDLESNEEAYRKFVVAQSDQIDSMAKDLGMLDEQVVHERDRADRAERELLQMQKKVEVLGNDHAHANEHLASILNEWQEPDYARRPSHSTGYKKPKGYKETINSIYSEDLVVSGELKVDVDHLSDTITEVSSYKPPPSRKPIANPSRGRRPAPVSRYLLEQRQKIEDENRSSAKR